MNRSSVDWMDRWATLYLSRIKAGPTTKCRRCKGARLDSKSKDGLCQTCNGKGEYPRHEGSADLDQSLVDLLRECLAFREPPPQALIDLIEFRLTESRKLKSPDRDSDRWEMAAKYLATHPEATVKMVVAAVRKATNLSISTSTIQEWKTNSHFISEVNFYRELGNDYEANGFHSCFCKTFLDPFDH